MDETFIRHRITECRVKKGISEYRLSTDMGHSKGYTEHHSRTGRHPPCQIYIYV